MVFGSTSPNKMIITVTDLVRVTDAPHEGNFWSMQLLTIIFDFIEKHIG